MVHSIHASRHTVYWVQAQVGFGRVYFPGPNRVGARAHFMRWAQPILRLSRRACARANDGLACVNAGQPLMKNLSHFVKSVLYIVFALFFTLFINCNPRCSVPKNRRFAIRSIRFLTNVHPQRWPNTDLMLVQRLRS